MNTNIQTLTTIWCVIIFLGLSGNLCAQTTDALFNEVSNAETVLSVSEFNRYTDLDNEKIKEKALIDITGLEQALRSSALSVPLKGVEHSLRRVSFSNAKEGSFTFKGSFTKAVGEVYLYQTDGYLYGNIHIDSLAYQIEPINKKYAVLLRRDYSEYICPLEEEHEGKEDTEENRQNGSSKSKSALMSNPVIDIMVVYSNQAAAAVNMQAHAQGSVQSSNDTFSNSDAGASFNLVHYQQISYSESGSVQTDHGRLLGTSDGYMDNVHSLRDQYGADVVVLIVSNDPLYCGTAGNIGVGSSQAFAVSVDNCSIGNYTFAHEIGHLAGARHENDGNGNPYAYGHGFRYDPAYWRTVMAVYDPQNPQTDRIPYWSNPDKYYGGIAMGTTSWRDNARVWDESAATMAAFRTTGPSVNISGPGHIPAGSGATYYANVSGGVSPYDYQWKKNGVNVGTNSSSYYLSTSPQDEGPVSLSVTVTDDNNNDDTDYFSVFVDPFLKVAATPEEYALSKNYPNPFNPSTNISYELPEQSSVLLEVYDVMGRKVRTLVNGNQSPGRYTKQFEASGLSSGVYIARMEAIGNSGEVFNQELKMQLIK